MALSRRHINLFIFWFIMGVVYWETNERGKFYSVAISLIYSFNNYLAYFIGYHFWVFISAFCSQMRKRHGKFMGAAQMHWGCSRRRKEECYREYLTLIAGLLDHKILRRRSNLDTKSMFTIRYY